MHFLSSLLLTSFFALHSLGYLDTLFNLKLRVFTPTNIGIKLPQSSIDPKDLRVDRTLSPLKLPTPLKQLTILTRSNNRLAPTNSPPS